MIWMKWAALAALGLLAAKKKSTAAGAAGAVNAVKTATTNAIAIPVSAPVSVAPTVTTPIVVGGLQDMARLLPDAPAPAPQIEGSIGVSPAQQMATGTDPHAGMVQVMTWAGPMWVKG